MITLISTTLRTIIEHAKLLCTAFGSAKSPNKHRCQLSSSLILLLLRGTLLGTNSNGSKFFFVNAFRDGSRRLARFGASFARESFGPCGWNVMTRSSTGSNGN